MMRSSFAALLLVPGLGVAAAAQTCTGLCLQQVSCPSGGTTSITGVVYAPNGIDPLPNVLVYIPNAPVDVFVPGVTCPVVGQPPSGAPLVGATSAVDGSFTITNVPVGTNIPLVIQSGRWRRQVTIPTTAACTDTAFSTRMPQNQTEGDIPKFAIATGGVDAVECVLRKVGIADSEFTNPNGTGRINIYLGSGTAGAEIDRTSPSEKTLMSNLNSLNSYDVLMLPCEGGAFPGVKDATQYANLVAFANAGGRIYSSHFSYQWLYQNPPFNTVANWKVDQAQLNDGVATVNAAFSGGQELSQWLQLVGASTTPGQIAISTLRHDMNGVIAPTESWMTLNNAAAGNPVMQMVFDTPVGATGNQCGRVLFNEYHVEAVTSSTGQTFPKECAPGAMTPQEKLLEYSLFELTNNGSGATLTPATQDFGTEAIGFNSAPQSFTWTNESTFSASVTLLKADGDFSVQSSNCQSVAASGSCTINVVFNPTAIGARTGTLTVGSSGTTLLSSLTGIGIPDLSLSLATLDFGSLDVGAQLTKTLTVTNGASGSVPVPAFAASGDFAVTTACGNTVAAGASCNLFVTFKPTVYGARTGTLSIQGINPGPPAMLTGDGMDFSIATTPASGTVIAGYGLSTSATMNPLGGFAANIHLTCSTTAPGTTCNPSNGSFNGGSATSTPIAITTTSQYTVVGYGGAGRFGALWLLAVASGFVLWSGRKSVRTALQAALVMTLLAVTALSLGGCSGKLPALNPIFTAPGTYTFTVTASDGFLVHSTTYSLNVTKN